MGSGGRLGGRGLEEAGTHSVGEETERGRGPCEYFFSRGLYEALANGWFGLLVNRRLYFDPLMGRGSCLYFS